MSKNGPNKTVAAARKRMGGFPARAPRPLDPFVAWLADKARAGFSFRTIEEAKVAYYVEEQP